MFTVFGATGNTGSVVASELLAAGKKVRVAVRDPKKVEALAARGAEVVTVDVLDAKSVAKALAGAEGAYLLTPPDPQARDLVGRGRAMLDGFVTALAESPVKHAVLLSSIAAQHPAGTGPIVIPHHGEQVLGKVKGTSFTFVRAAYFMENLLAYAHPMRGDGVLPVFGGGEGVKFPMIATHDIGVVAAGALLSPPTSTQVIELEGPEPYSFEDAAAAASAIMGKPVKALALPLDAMVPALTQVGLSENVAGLYREMTEGMAKGLMTFEGKGTHVRGKVTLSEVLERGLRG